MVRAEARRSGRRVLAYFTGDYCGWCRVMEQRTFTDADVVTLSQRFVCVEVNVEKEENLRLADEFGIDSIPRSLILTAEGQVIDRRTGYIPAAEYADWLKEAGIKYVMLKVRPGEPREGSFPTDNFATGMPVRWCVWSISAAAGWPSRKSAATISRTTKR